MKTRELVTADLKVTKSFACRSGAIRTHVSLKGASFVSKTFWIQERDMAKPETLERIKADLSKMLQSKTDALAKYSL